MNKNTSKNRWIAASLMICLLGATGQVAADKPGATGQAGPKATTALSNPSISRWVIASGGGLASNGGYELRGAIGQPVAATSSGGIYSLKSGYHSEDDLIFRHDLDQ